MVVVEESGSFGFPIFIFVKFLRVGIFVLLLPALDFGIDLLLCGFTNFLYRIFKGLLLSLILSIFNIPRTIMAKYHAHVIPHII